MRKERRDDEKTIAQCFNKKKNKKTKAIDAKCLADAAFQRAADWGSTAVVYGDEGNLEIYIYAVKAPRSSVVRDQACARHRCPLAMDGKAVRTLYGVSRIYCCDARLHRQASLRTLVTGLQKAPPSLLMMKSAEYCLWMNPSAASQRGEHRAREHGWLLDDERKYKSILLS